MLLILMIHGFLWSTSVSLRLKIWRQVKIFSVNTENQIYWSLGKTVEKSFNRYLLDRRKKHWPIIFLFFWYWYYFVTPINVLFCRPLLINWKLIKWMIFPRKNNYFEISVMFFEKNMKIIFFRKLVLTDILAKM